MALIYEPITDPAECHLSRAFTRWDSKGRKKKGHCSFTLNTFIKVFHVGPVCLHHSSLHFLQDIYLSLQHQSNLGLCSHFWSLFQMWEYEPTFKLFLVHIPCNFLLFVSLNEQWGNHPGSHFRSLKKGFINFIQDYEYNYKCNCHRQYVVHIFRWKRLIGTFLPRLFWRTDV